MNVLKQWFPIFIDAGAFFYFRWNTTAAPSTENSEKFELLLRLHEKIPTFFYLFLFGTIYDEPREKLSCVFIGQKLF